MRLTRPRWTATFFPIVMLAIAVLLGGPPARAWDAGPSQCKHLECNGGALAVETGVPDTQPKYADSAMPGSVGRVADCPSGYTNNGLTCGRGADTIAQSSRVADCPSGYTNNGATCGRGADSIGAGSRVADCPDGYTNMGLSCYRGPDTYSKKCTLPGIKKYDCRSGYTDNGCTCGRGASSLGASKMDCPSGYFLNSDLGRCYKKCPKGYTNTGETCFRGASTLGMGSMSCQSGEFKTGARCYKSCPSGYTNTGETCFKPASTRGIDSMSCKADEFQSGVRCYDNDTCAADREFWGGLCYKKCPAGSTRTAVSTCVHDIHWRGNTHLFIVNRALELLAKSSDPVAVAAAKKMNEKDCRTSWETGLWNGDDGALADTPGKATGSHFYDGSGKDEQGGWTPVVTYTIAGLEQTANGNARTRAQARIDDVVKEVKACENLGLALHYLTDMTQPMHATTFSGISIPPMLHPVLEDYVPSLQAGFPKVTAWDERWTGKLPDEVFLEASKKSADLAPGLMATLKDDGTNCTMTPEGGITYSGYCFLNVPRVNAALAQVVTDGYQSTASYIYAVFNNAQSGTP